jgi:hypothetical protein
VGEILSASREVSERALLTNPQFQTHFGKIASVCQAPNRIISFLLNEMELTY